MLEKNTFEKDKFLHTIAIETAKMYVNSNPQDEQLPKPEELAKDLATNYIHAYIVAAEVFEVKRNRLQTKGLL